MKPFLLAITALLLPASHLTAGQLYQINFTGSLNSGTAFDFNPADNLNEQIADLTGLTVSGSLFYDLGVAPAPTFTVDGGGFLDTALQTTSGPVFMGETLTINGLVVPAGFDPMPTTFDLPIFPTLEAGSTLTTVQSIQSLRTSTLPSGTVQTIITGLNFNSSWTGPRFSGSNLIAVNLLVSSLNSFFVVPPAGQFPASWGPATDGQNGVFTFFERAQDNTLADHFGITQLFEVTGNFALTSADGGFVTTPEPGTFVLAGSLLLVLARLRANPRT
jgi:hypothetical protein